MGDVLYLAHRLPYPPNKGDKLRSYHLLKHIGARHRVFLGTFVDDPDDMRHIGAVQSFCADMHVAQLDPLRARLRSLSGLAANAPLTVPYYRDAALHAWVNRTLNEQPIDAIVVFSSAMAQYVPTMHPARVFVDFVDVDSAKWLQYADAKKWPLSWLYRREGTRLFEFERAAAHHATRSFFVTEAETELFRRLAPAAASRVETIGNGVDSEFFAPREWPSPFPAGSPTIVFTGAMDYWPNMDAVRWFAANVLPRLRAAVPGVRFAIVGMRPAPAVKALAGNGIIVTGTVPDIRAYLHHAAIVVAPLRIARGVQNKVLEAMAMERPVVASEACAAAIDAVVGRDLLSASDAAQFVEAIQSLLADPGRAATLGRAARRCILERYSWDAQLAAIDRHLDAAPRASSAAA
jgi:sugar transferase (PEP-CTERM/EpsH1 system associated)